MLPSVSSLSVCVRSCVHVCATDFYFIHVMGYKQQLFVALGFYPAQEE